MGIRQQVEKALFIGSIENTIFFLKNQQLPNICVKL